MPTGSDRPSTRSAPAPDTAPREVRLDEAGHLVESFSCRSCGYDLKGIAADGVCPECAGMVERSIRGDLLRFCDPAWLDRLRRGLLLIAVGILGGTVLQIGIIIATGFVGAIVTTRGGGPRAMTVVMVAGGLVMAFVTLVNVVGGWLITTQDPGRTETEAPLSARGVARYGIIVSLVSSPMQMVMGQAGTLTGGGGLRAVDLILIVVAFGTALLALVGWVAFYIYVRQIVLRVPYEQMARQVRVIMWGYAISTSISLAFGFTSTYLLATGRLSITGGSAGAAMQATSLGISIGSCASALTFMAFELWAAVLFLVLRNRLTVMVAEGRARTK